MDLLLVIRGLAALAVVVWHSTGYLGEFPAVVNLPGRTAVWLFFGMSGYVIAYGFIHKRYSLTLSDVKLFYLNRFLRIYPLFIALSFLAWISELAITGKSPIGIRDIPAQLLALQLHHDYVLNGVFWTLGIEIQYYYLRRY
jgi:peptidoglycan/LPS O-acetylase OafA/YrhL